MVKVKELTTQQINAALNDIQNQLIYFQNDLRKVFDRLDTIEKKLPKPKK